MTLFPSPDGMMHDWSASGAHPRTGIRPTTSVSRCPACAIIRATQNTGPALTCDAQPLAAEIVNDRHQHGRQGRLRPVHFTTVARWKRQGLLTIARTSESAEPEASPENLFAELPPPVSPLEAKRVWDEQRRPSSRSGVAEALTQAGRSIHFTTVARWKRREWQVEARLEHPLAAAMRMVDLAVPLLTGDPTTKAMDIFRAAAANRQGTIEDRAPHRATRDSLITLIILGQLLRLHLIPFRPLEIAVFIRAISQAHLAIAKADAQLLGDVKELIKRPRQP